VVVQLLRPLAYAPQAVQLLPMPIDGTVFDLFWTLAGALIPWCFVLIFKYSEYPAISTFMQEKETRVREGLKMMVKNSTAVRHGTRSCAALERVVKILLLKNIAADRLARGMWKMRLGPVDWSTAAQSCGLAAEVA
jgi:hypothetical protein